MARTTIFRACYALECSRETLANHKDVIPIYGLSKILSGANPLVAHLIGHLP